MIETVPRSAHAPQPLPSAKFIALYKFLGTISQIIICIISENAAPIIPRMSADTAWNFTNPLLFSKKKNTSGTAHATHFRYGIHDTTIMAPKMTIDAMLAFMPSEDLCGWISIFFIIIVIPFINIELLMRASRAVSSPFLLAEHPRVSVAYRCLHDIEVRPMAGVDVRVCPRPRCGIGGQEG